LKNLRPLHKARAYKEDTDEDFKHQAEIVKLESNSGFDTTLKKSREKDEQDSAAEMKVRARRTGHRGNSR
jgi:hypothetical protein